MNRDWDRARAITIVGDKLSDDVLFLCNSFYSLWPALTLGLGPIEFECHEKSLQIIGLVAKHFGYAFNWRKSFPGDPNLHEVIVTMGKP